MSSKESESAPASPSFESGFGAEGAERRPGAPTFEYEIVAGASVIDELEHVSNIAYVGWIQEAAKAHSAAVGWDTKAYFDLGVVFVVRRHEIEYLASVREGERVRVSTWIEKWTAVTSERRTRIVRADTGADVIRAKTLWAMIDFATGRPRRVPQEIREAFLRAGFGPRSSGAAEPAV